MTMTLEEIQIRSEAAKVVIPITSTTTTSTPTTLSATPTTRPPLPCYKGKQVDDSDLLEAIDRANHKLFEASGLVNSILGQVILLGSLDFRESTRPTRATTRERLGTSLAITATPKGRTIRFRITSLNGSFPHGLGNTADQVSCYTRQLFRRMDLSPQQPTWPTHHFINMVSVHTLQEDNTASMNSSTGSVPTEVLHPEDEDYDLDLLPYPHVQDRDPHH